jgi:type I restriction enzyme M protein
MSTHTLVQKLWNYCSVLRDDGMSYGDYVEQLTYLLFLKMADERSQPPYNQTSIVPAAYAWPTLLGRDGDDCLTTTATRWKSWAKKRARWA